MPGHTFQVLREIQKGASLTPYEGQCTEYLVQNLPLGGVECRGAFAGAMSFSSQGPEWRGRRLEIPWLQSLRSKEK